MSNYDLDEAAVASVNAGSDIILVCHDYDKEESVIKALTKAAETGVITRERIEQSVYRILKLKQKYAISDQTADSTESQEMKNKIAEINERINELFKRFPLLKND